MTIEFTKKQYENLIKLIYLGNWMINAFRIDEGVKKFEEVTDYIYSFAKDFGLEKYIEYDEKFNKFYPTREFEEDTDIEHYMDEYDAETFWDELVHNLATRDFIGKYGEDAIRKMDFKERIEKEEPFIGKYEKEFEKHGIENLEIKE